VAAPRGRAVSAAELGALQAIADGARSSGRIALDTEFMGEGRYRTLLCLIQLAVAEEAVEGDRILVVDPLAEDFDGSPLAVVLADPEIQVVVHAGRQDVALARRVLETEVTNIFDTQVAAGFAGLGAQSSYDSLLQETLGLRLPKSASFTRWDARPLSDEQVSYARDDVVHLLQLAEALEARLRELGRLGWAQQECEPLTRASDVRDLEVIFQRLPRIGSLPAASRPVARELVRWREQTAERQDRPVQSVLGDATLMEIAKRRPRGRAELERIRGVGSSAGGRRGQELLDCVARGIEQPPDPAPPSSGGPAPKPDDAPLVALGESLLRTRAREAGLAYELLAARADLQAIVSCTREGAPEPDVRTLRGWRRELAGEELLALLAGGISLSVGGSGRARRVRIEPLAEEQS